MQEFIAKHQEKIAGTLSGFDRLVFRGHLRSIGNPQGMMSYLWTNQVYLKNFGDHVEMVTKRLKEASLAEAKACGRPVEYLNSSQSDKETIARDILAHDKVRSGLVCVLSCLEPCLTFAIHRNCLTKKLELKRSPGKCLFLYHYQIHPGMAGATDACHRFGLLAAGQLLSLDCQLDPSAALDGSSAQDQMA
jgi:hypothetical protein